MSYLAQWSPDGSCIAVWDGPLQDGVCLYTPEGEYLAQYSAHVASLGVRAVAWAPSGQLLAIGSSDQAGSASPWSDTARQTARALPPVLIITLLRSVSEHT